jgi:hypothetical protein
MPKTDDYLYAFRGTWDREPEGRCRVRILQGDGKPPILVLTELTSNPSTSVTVRLGTERWIAATGG